MTLLAYLCSLLDKNYILVKGRNSMISSQAQSWKNNPLNERGSYTYSKSLLKKGTHSMSEPQLIEKGPHTVKHVFLIRKHINKATACKRNVYICTTYEFWCTIDKFNHSDRLQKVNMMMGKCYPAHCNKVLSIFLSCLFLHQRLTVCISVSFYAVPILLEF